MLASLADHQAGQRQHDAHAQPAIVARPQMGQQPLQRHPWPAEWRNAGAAPGGRSAGSWGWRGGAALQGRLKILLRTVNLRLRPSLYSRMK